MTKNTAVVYIVDDDESVRRGLSRLICSAGHNPVSFDTAESFMENITNKTPACILMDITMPGTTGLLVQKQLSERGIDLPVIVISARDDDEIRQLARDLGVKFYFQKPVDDNALLDAIAWVLCSKQQDRVFGG